MGKPNISVTSNRWMVQYKLIGADWVPSVLCTTILAAMYLPYAIVLLRGTLQPILPLVSQAAGSPPQSGIFSVLLSLTSMISFLGLNGLHMAIQLHSKKLEDKTQYRAVQMMNKTMLISGLFGIVGIMIVAGYPMDFHRHLEDWYTVSLIPHFIGASSLFVGGELFCISFTYIMSVLYPQKTELRNTRLTIIAFIMLTATLHSAMLYQSFMKEYNDDSRLKSCSNIKVQYDYLYIFCSFLEWVFLTAFVAFFATIKEETKDFCISFTVTTNNSETDHKPADLTADDHQRNGQITKTVNHKNGKIS